MLNLFRPEISFEKIQTSLFLWGDIFTSRVRTGKIPYFLNSSGILMGVENIFLTKLILNFDPIASAPSGI